MDVEGGLLMWKKLFHLSCPSYLLLTREADILKTNILVFVGVDVSSVMYFSNYDKRS